MSLNLKLIGYPIKHSMSPWIHNQFIEISELKGQYSLFEIKPEDDFEKKIVQLKREQIDGFNITVPYKEKIIPYLDKMDKTAEMMGAVNTVHSRNGKWTGYNTDGIGYVRAVKNAFPFLFNNKETKVLIIGAGGAARAIYYALAENDVKTIDILNRTAKKAEEIAVLGQEKTKTAIYDLEQGEAILENYDLIVQTTSVGMKPNESKTPVVIKKLKTDAVVSDIIYQPIKTAFLKQAEQAGGNIHYGHTMLIYQAQYAFEIWTGKQVEADAMIDTLQANLEGR